MSILKIKMFTVICDNCQESADKDTDYSCWNDKITAKDVAMESGFINENNKHYCSKCHSYNDKDELIINIERKVIKKNEKKVKKEIDKKDFELF
jgi:hypothetical protein